VGGAAQPEPRLAKLAPDVAAYADPAQSIGYLLRLAFRASIQALESRTIIHGVSSGQWHFLRELWREDGLTQRELSSRAGMREPTTVVAVTKLVEADFVKRAPDANDRRKIHIQLTHKGRDLAPILLPLVAEVNARATAGLTTEEIEALRKGLRKVCENMSR